MLTMTTLFTRADYETLPEGYPAQLIDGCLVKEPSPTYDHQRCQMRLLQRIVTLIGPDLVLPAPADVLIDELNVFQPDIVVLREPVAGDEHYVGVPRLAVEILSPSTRGRDRDFKARRLLGAGVREVWLVDPVEKTIEVASTDGSVIYRGDERAPSVALDGFAVTPDDLFSPPAV